jgi:hypothetical protein
LLIGGPVRTSRVGAGSITTVVRLPLGLYSFACDQRSVLRRFLPKTILQAIEFIVLSPYGAASSPKLGISDGPSNVRLGGLLISLALMVSWAET